MPVSSCCFSSTSFLFRLVRFGGSLFRIFLFSHISLFAHCIFCFFVCAYEMSINVWSGYVFYNLHFTLYCPPSYKTVYTHIYKLLLFPHSLFLTRSVSSCDRTIFNFTRSIHSMVKRMRARVCARLYEVYSFLPPDCEMTMTLVSVCATYRIRKLLVFTHFAVDRVNRLLHRPRLLPLTHWQ